jgi:hypothetical protein
MRAHRRFTISPHRRHYDRIVSDKRRAGCPGRGRNEGEGFWAFLRDWIASLFRVDEQRRRTDGLGEQEKRAS